MSRDIDNTMVVTMMQRMAWQRAKGELLSILETFYGERDDYIEMDKIINDFIEKVENESPIA
jgi:hypothetical protein